MNARQKQFVVEYLIDLNASQAAIRAGYSKKTSRAIGFELLAKTSIATAIQQAMAKRSERTEITADAVLERLWAIATADPRELVEYRHTCCRFCHGKQHQYQFTAAELAREKRTWEAKQTKASKDAFDEQGGIGFNGTLAPDPACPECFGEGVERLVVHDTRRLSASALCLYAGVKSTKDGIEVKMHAQDAALVNVGRHLGLFADKPETPITDDERIARIRAALVAMDAATAGAA